MTVELQRSGPHPADAEYRPAAETAGLSPEQTLLDRLRSWRDLAPERACIERIDVGRGDELERTLVTLTELLDAARACAARLSRAGVGPGDRALLCLPNTEVFAAWFLGAHWLGAIPVPLPSLAGFGAKAPLVERLRGVVEDCGPRVLVGDSATVRTLGDIAFSGRGLALLDADANAGPVGEAAAPHAPGAGETAFIQYTSGSTGVPRGVLVTHGNLRANAQAIALKMRAGPSDRMLIWLPLYHDMGLVGGLVVPLYAGYPVLLMSPLSFLMRPARWLRAMSQFKATMTVAPNFAYSLCLRKVRDRDLEGLDLSALRLTYSGAEPIDADTARGFVERFARSGLPEFAFYPVYGLAEATLAAAFPEPGEPLFVDHIDRSQLGRGRAVAVAAPGAGVASFVAVGRAVPGHAIEIRDPEGEAIFPERHLGEIVLHGPSVTPGYFSLAGPPTAPRTMLRTGDLGYLALGRLFVVDRVKDLIIVEGRNITPSDVERSLKIDGVRPGRAVAFGVPDAENGTEGVVVVAETTEASAARIQAICARIRSAVLADHAHALLDVALVEAGTLPRTSSGKVMRRKSRELYLAKKLVAAGSTSRARRLWSKVVRRARALVHAVISSRR